MGLEIVEPSVYFKEQLKFAKQTKFKFASLQERLLANLRSKESEKSKNGTPRPPPFDSYCPSMEDKLDECICGVMYLEIRFILDLVFPYWNQYFQILSCFRYVALVGHVQLRKKDI